MSAVWWDRPPTLAVIVALALLGGCGRDEFKVEFMEGRVQGGGSKAVCRCVFDQMEPELRAPQAGQQLSLSGEAVQRLGQVMHAHRLD